MVFAAMADGKAEIVQSSRRVLHAEAEALRSAQGRSYVELQVANEIAGISVNAANPAKEGREKTAKLRKGAEVTPRYTAQEAGGFLTSRTPFGMTGWAIRQMTQEAEGLLI